MQLVFFAWRKLYTSVVEDVTGFRRTFSLPKITIFMRRIIRHTLLISHNSLAPFIWREGWGVRMVRIGDVASALREHPHELLYKPVRDYDTLKRSRHCQ
jgi:hypothetical protein